MQFGTYLEKRLQEALRFLRQRNPDLGWGRDEVIRLAVGYGLNALFRSAPRVSVSYPATVWRLYPAGAYYKAKVTDLSITGLGFAVADGRTSFKRGEILLIEFNAHGSIMQKALLVRRVTGTVVGCAFVDPEETKDVESLLSNL
ncbi:PilZ domain-containing protein [Desulfacinum infernum]|uniref:PilZ domain-containing protein n=1 Tax=Desulfacinum infernum TaxID=35837 RepID=UPI000932D5A2|nr:PilZ domain-containing protein [Desulfacinum infernum]